MVFLLIKSKGVPDLPRIGAYFAARFQSAFPLTARAELLMIQIALNFY
jgi:hypothetical protein